MIGLLSIVALGFFLGMRHATDPDHVIAVTTIVSRYKKVGHAAVIGAFWGIGHTLTIFVVGSGIILFGWVIPTRIGLSMEFSVGLMLILLGVLNLTGMLQWITNSFSGGPASVGAGHSHPHTHGDYIHTHPHRHNPEAHPHDAAQTPLGWFDRHFGQIGDVSSCYGRSWLGWSMGLQGRPRWRCWFSPRFGIRNGQSPICLFLGLARSRE